MPDINQGFETPKNTNNKTIFIVIGIVIFVLILAIGGYFGYTVINKNKVEDKKAVENANTNKVDEATRLVNENKAVLDQATTNKGSAVRKIDSSDYIQGDTSAPVQLVIYNDFSDTFCQQFYDTIKKIKEEYKDKIVFTLRHNPLRSHTMSLTAALAAECANEQGKYWEMTEKLFNDSKEGNLSAEQYKQDALDLKLDGEKFNECLDTEKYKDRVQKQMDEARNLNVNGAPGSFINGQPIPGAYPYDDFMDQEGQKKMGMKSLVESKLNAGN